MDGHDGGGNKADRMFGQRPHHLLAPFAANELSFAFLFSHELVLPTEPRSPHDRRQGYSRLNGG